MKIRIDAAPGELEARADDVARTIYKLAGKDCCGACQELEKAAKTPPDQAPRKLDLPALQGGVDRASKAVERIRKKMLADMLAVTKSAR